MTTNIEKRDCRMSEYRREQAFRAGRVAGLAGKPETANNRQPGTIFYDDWADGWQEGERAIAKFIPGAPGDPS